MTGKVAETPTSITLCSLGTLAPTSHRATTTPRIDSAVATSPSRSIARAAPARPSPATRAVVTNVPKNHSPVTTQRRPIGTGVKRSTSRTSKCEPTFAAMTSTKNPNSASNSRTPSLPRRRRAPLSNGAKSNSLAGRESSAWSSTIEVEGNALSSMGRGYSPTFLAREDLRLYGLCGR